MYVIVYGSSLRMCDLWYTTQDKDFTLSTFWYSDISQSSIQYSWRVSQMCYSPQIFDVQWGQQEGDIYIVAPCWVQVGSAWSNGSSRVLPPGGSERFQRRFTYSHCCLHKVRGLSHSYTAQQCNWCFRSWQHFSVIGRNVAAAVTTETGVVQTSLHVVMLTT